MIAPHSGDIAKIGSHAFAIHDESKVGGKDVLAKSVAVEAGHVSQGMHDLVREAVQEQINIGAHGAWRAATAFAFFEFVKKRSEVSVILKIDCANCLFPFLIKPKHLIGGQPASYTRFIEFEVERLILLLRNVDWSTSIRELGKRIEPDGHGNPSCVILAKINRRR